MFLEKGLQGSFQPLRHFTILQIEQLQNNSGQKINHKCQNEVLRRFDQMTLTISFLFQSDNDLTFPLETINQLARTI